MGEIADMMLDGTMCAGCGEFLNDGEDGDGFPEYCSACAPDYTEDKEKKNSAMKKLYVELKDSQRSSESWLQSSVDCAIDRVNYAHQALTGNPLSKSARKRLRLAITEVMTPHIMPKDGEEK